MYGSSRTSLAALSDSLLARRGDAGLTQLSADLLAVASLVSESHSLRQTLCDGGIPESGRRAIVDQLLAGQVSAPALDLVGQVVSSRWSHDHDLVEALETLGAQAALQQAQNDGTLDQVEDDLFRFGRALEASDELQLTLTDPAIPADRKAGVVRDLLAGSSPVTDALLTYLAGHLAGRAPIQAVARLSDLAAAQRQQVVADVSTAVSLTDEQQTRLAAALSRLTGHQVHLNIEIVPEVLGGILVQIGDEVIDGSISGRLEQARRALAG